MSDDNFIVGFQFSGYWASVSRPPSSRILNPILDPEIPESPTNVSYMCLHTAAYALPHPWNARQRIRYVSSPPLIRRTHSVFKGPTMDMLLA